MGNPGARAPGRSLPSDRFVPIGLSCWPRTRQTIVEPTHAFRRQPAPPGVGARHDERQHIYFNALHRVWACQPALALRNLGHGVFQHASRHLNGTGVLALELLEEVAAGIPWVHAITAGVHINGRIPQLRPGVNREMRF